MTEEELSKVLLTMLPVNKIDPNPTEDRCKYQIGTQAFGLIIRANKIMVRVGGGFATLEEHIKQIGPFECIKIYKHIKTEEATKGLRGRTSK